MKITRDADELPVVDKECGGGIRNGSNHPQNTVFGQNSQKTQSNHGIYQQACFWKIRIYFIDKLIKTFETLMKLRADATHKIIAERRHFFQQQAWAVFLVSSNLRQPRQYDTSFSHDL